VFQAAKNDASQGVGEFQSWKKRKTNLYLRKYRLMGRTRCGAECFQCGLMFDNSTMLDLHVLAHAATTGIIDEPILTVVVDIVGTHNQNDRHIGRRRRRFRIDS